MNADDTFERTVSRWLHEAAQQQVPDHLETVLQRTRTERQRSAWSSPGRWLPMDTTFSGRIAPALRPAWILVAVGLLLITLVAAVLLGGSRPRVLPPFGLAANGVMFYADDGDIYVAAPDGNEPRLLDGGPSRDIAVVVSRDGAHIAIARLATGAQVEFLIADADGSDVRSMTPTPLAGLTWADWSPDGTRLAATDANSLWILHADGVMPQRIDFDMTVDRAFWRPDGNQLVIRGLSLDAGSETAGFYVVGADGTGLREVILLDPENGDPDGALSPDGNQIVYTQWDGDAYPGGHLYVADVRTGDRRLLEFDGAHESDYFARWSPDGSQLVFNQGAAQEEYFVAVAPAKGGHATRLGPVMAWAAAAEVAFSPDGLKVIARYDDGSTWLFDRSGGPGRELEFGTSILPSWQRLAP